MIDKKLESRAESTGYMCREVGDPRDSNPYLQHLDVSPALAREFADAWWRGWDRADAVSKDGPMQQGHVSKPSRL